MNGNFRIGILVLIGTVVLGGVLGTVLSRGDASLILSLCTMVCVSLLALLHQNTSGQLNTIAHDTKEQNQIITQVKNQTDRIVKKLADQLGDITKDE